MRVSAAELALFHTGAILSTLGYHLPETATWERSGGDKCVFGVCAEALVCTKMCVCVRRAVVSDKTFTPNLLSAPYVRCLCPRLSNQ